MVNYLNKFSQSQEDYLKTIYSLREKASGGDVKSVAIAKNLYVSKAAVSKMIRRLRNQNLVKTDPYSAVKLTQKGERQAKMLVRKHRLIEVFLVNHLKIDQKKMHEEAHKIEHTFSDETTKKLEIFLGVPKFSPEGHPIPKM